MKIERGTHSYQHAHIGIDKHSLQNKQIQKISRNCITSKATKPSFKFDHHIVTKGVVAQPKGRPNKKRA